MARKKTRRKAAHKKAAHKPRKRKASRKKKSTTKRTGKGHVPLKVLEKRLVRLGKIVAVRQKSPAKWK